MRSTDRELQARQLQVRQQAKLQLITFVFVSAEIGTALISSRFDERQQIEDLLLG